MKTKLFSRFVLERSLSRTPSRTTFVARDKLRDDMRVVVRSVRRNDFSTNLWKVSSHLSWYQGVRHQNLLPIDECGIAENGDLYVVRPYVPNTNIFKEESPAWSSQFVSLALFLHRCKRIHGGIKPSNLFLASHSLSLMDPWIPKDGLAPAREEEIHYIAPELLRGSAPSLDSDLYSVGAVLYRAFAGKDPFSDFTRESLTTKYLHAEPQKLSQFCSVSTAVSDSIHALLDRNPAARSRGLETLRETFGKALPASRAAFAGRVADLQDLIQRCSSNKTRNLNLICIEGNAGIGKTRLLQEFEMRLRFYDMDFIAVQSSLVGSNARLAKSLLELAVKRSESGFGTLAQQLGTLYEVFVALKDGAETPMGASVLIGSIAALAQKKSLVIAFELTSPLDTATEQLFEHLRFRANEIPLTVILTFRPWDRPIRTLSLMQEYLGGRITTLRLEHLGPEESVALSESLGPPEHQEWAIENSGGNPLILESYLHEPRQAIPPIARDLFVTLLSELDQEGKQLLEAASILDPEGELSALEGLVGEALPFQLVLGRLVANGILNIENNCFVFRYPALPTWIRERMSASRKKDLHIRAYAALRSTNSGSSKRVADHAFRAKLFSESLDLYTQLLDRYREAGNHSEAIYCYERAFKCAHHLGLSPRVEDELDIATCYSRVGKNWIARQICQRLLLDRRVTADSKLMSKVYLGLALSELDGSNPQIAYYRKAIEVTPRIAPELGDLYARLAQSLCLRGALGGAEAVIEEAKALTAGTPTGVAPTLLDAMTGYIHVHRGNFIDALKCLGALRYSNLAARAAILSNIALCLEQLGSLRKAEVAQQEAITFAKRSGYATGEIISWSNLGTFSAKLGKFSKAEECFRSAQALIGNHRQENPNFKLKQVSVAYSDEAMFRLELGCYSEAHGLFRKAWTFQAELAERDKVVLALTGAEIQLHLEDRHGAAELVGHITASEVFDTPFFQVENALLRGRMQSNATETEELGYALVVTRRLGTAYQKCRVLLELAEHHWRRNEATAAITAVAEALLLARKNGYRPLQARSILLRGLMAKSHRDRECHLLEAIKLAEEVGIPELVAEGSYHLGCLQMDAVRISSAHEYLLKSQLITKRLAENVPKVHRTAYLAKPWRANAVNRLAECALYLVKREDVNARDKHLMKGLYKVSATAKTSSDRDAFLVVLAQALADSLGRPALLLLKPSAGPNLLPTRLKLTDEVRKNLQAISEKYPNKSYFGGAGRNDVRGSVAWVPFETAEFSGGMYVQCRRRDERLSEQEMEYLTILGTIAGSALDRIQQRRVEPAREIEREDFHGLVGSSRVMKAVYRQIEVAGSSPATVLIEGESGTGKELVARAIHQCGNRAKGPFIPVDCGAIPETLIESELFGSRKGSFTGAIADRPGLFEAAHGGTIFLDEISNTSAGLQAKLLRVIQEREVRRIGEAKARAVDVRLIVATNTNLDSLVQQKQFRQDLLYRLNVLHIKVPPLRSRRDDIPQLVATLIDKLNVSHRARKHSTPAFIEQLSTLSFPGNVRELHNIVERSYVFSKGAAITTIPSDQQPATVSPDEIQTLFKDLSEGRKDFWSAVHDPYKRRDISREKVLALMDLGLRSTKGNYKEMAAMFQVKEKDYRRFMDFLRRSDCGIDFRPYRKQTA